MTESMNSMMSAGEDRLRAVWMLHFGPQISPDERATRNGKKWSFKD
jgi:hypothetical protein